MTVLRSGPTGLMPPVAQIIRSVPPPESSPGLPCSSSVEFLICFPWRYLQLRARPERGRVRWEDALPATKKARLSLCLHRGFICAIAPKRWRLDINFSQDAVLMLSSMNLPDGIQPINDMDFIRQSKVDVTTWSQAIATYDVPHP